MTRIAALDDYQGVALVMADWGRLQAQGEVVVFRRNLASEDEAASALAEFDVRHNAAWDRRTDVAPGVFERVGGKIYRVVRKLPVFLRNA